MRTMKFILLGVFCAALSGTIHAGQTTGDTFDMKSGSGTSLAGGKQVESRIGRTFGHVELRPAAGARGEKESDAMAGLSSDAAGAEKPLWVGVRPSHPNPFNPTTSIEYAVGERGFVTLRIYDVSGRVVRTLVSDTRDPGKVHVAVWDGRDERGRSVSSGVYFYRLEARNLVQTRKMVLLK